MINIFRQPKAVSAKISFFHNPKLATSSQLLSKLYRFSALPATSKLAPGDKKFDVDVSESKLPTFQEYLGIYNSLSMHPGNAHAFEKAFPMMFDAQSHTLCKRKASSYNKRKIVLGDLEIFSAEDYKIIEDAFYKEGNASFNAPLVVDWENELIATDEAGLDRIMANYLSCGTQDTQRGGYNGNLFKEGKHSKPNQHHQHIHQHVLNVHPHVAEFADLF